MGRGSAGRRPGGRLPGGRPSGSRSPGSLGEACSGPRVSMGTGSQTDRTRALGSPSTPPSTPPCGSLEGGVPEDSTLGDDLDPLECGPSGVGGTCPSGLPPLDSSSGPAELRSLCPTEMQGSSCPEVGRRPEDTGPGGPVSSPQGRVPAAPIVSPVTHGKHWPWGWHVGEWVLTLALPQAPSEGAGQRGPSPRSGR